MAIEIVVSDLCAGYGQVTVLRGVSLRVAEAETVVLLGTNGNGKSTLMKSLIGLVRPTSGRIEVTIDGQRLDLTRMTTESIVNSGIALVPEGRHLFPKLTVAANLKLGAYRTQARADADLAKRVVYDTAEGAAKALVDRLRAIHKVVLMIDTATSKTCVTVQAVVAIAKMIDVLPTGKVRVIIPVGEHLDLATAVRNRLMTVMSKLEHFMITLTSGPSQGRRRNSFVLFSGDRDSLAATPVPNAIDALGVRARPGEAPVSGA